MSPGTLKFLALPKCIEWQFKAAFNKDDKISRIIWGEKHAKDRMGQALEPIWKYIEWKLKATPKSKMSRLQIMWGEERKVQALDIKLFELGPEQTAEFGMYKLF